MKVVFFDTESTDLSASWGHMLCASFVDLGSDEVLTLRKDRRPCKGRDKVDDSGLVVKIAEQLEAADMVVSWNGIMHDIPLLNARLALAGYPPVKLKRHLDLMYYVAGRNGAAAGLKIGSRRLDTAAKFFGLEHQKTVLDGRTWQLAAVGDKKAMDYIADHCEKDILVLRDLFPYLAPMVKKFQFNLSEVYHLLDSI